MTGPTESIVEHKSPYDFAETLRRITRAIEGAGLTIFATIDHAAGARGVGLALPPATVLIYGHAKGGTPIMQTVPLAALDLPLRVLVHETPDGSAIAFRPAAVLLAAAGVGDDLARRLEPAQALLIKALDHE